MAKFSHFIIFRPIYYLANFGFGLMTLYKVNLASYTIINKLVESLTHYKDGPNRCLAPILILRNQL